MVQRSSVLRSIWELARRGKDSQILLVIGFANLGIGMATVVLLARLLPKAEYGEYVFAFGLANIAALPIELGLPTLMMREIARYRADEDERKIVAVIAWVFALIAGSFLIVVSSLLLFLEQGEQTPLISVSLALWSVALLLPLALMHWARGVLQGFEHPIQFALPDSIFRPVLLLVFVSAAAVAGVLDATVTMMANVAAVALCFAWALHRSLKVLGRAEISLAFKRTDLEWRKWLSALWPITLISGVQIINRRISIVLIGALTTAAAVADYNIALQITSVILVAQTVLNQRIGPKIAFAYRKGDHAVMQHHVAYATLVSSALAIASVGGLIIFGPWLIPMVFGKEYASVYMITVILCAGQLFSGLMGPTALLLTMSKYERKALRTGVVAAAVNIALAVYLVPRLSAVGAAIAVSTTLIVIQTERWWMVLKHVGIRSDVLAAVKHWKLGPNY